MSKPVSPALHLGLWVVQVLLALLFLGAGSFKATSPAADLAAGGMTLPIGVLRFAGISEVLGAIGLILPSALRILPRVTGAAAIGLVTVMILGVGMHGTKGEIGGVVTCVVIGSLAAFVAWGRLLGAPIAPRSAG